MPINSILVAVDGSENSNRALDLALDLADKFGASVLVLNVSEAPTVTAVPMEPTSYPIDSMVVVSKDLRKFHEETLSRAVDRAKTAKPNLTVDSRLLEGDPAKEIVGAAKEGGFDVIVVGHRGLGKVQEFFLGNVSAKVAHSAQVPVIIVK